MTYIRKALLLITLFLSALVASAKENLTQYVNTFIGTTNYGTTNLGAVCPNGMMSVTPFNVMGSELNRYDTAEICVAQKGGRPVMFSITVKDNSAESRYIQSVLLNGEPYYKGYIEHKDIAAGGELVLQMGAEPVLWY